MPTSAAQPDAPDTLVSREILTGGVNVLRAPQPLATLRESGENYNLQYAISSNHTLTNK